jgi:hypothetical protein
MLMRMQRLLPTAGFVVVTAGALSAQPPFRQIAGTLRDSASGHVPLRAQVCAWPDSGSVRPPPRCALVDSVGNYRLDSVAPGRRLLAVHCPTIHAGLTQLAFAHVVIADANLQRNWVVPATGCDPRPERHLTRTFRGYYTPGFESSAFVPCPRDAWFLPSDSLDSEPYMRHAWVTWPPDLLREIQWPDAPRDSFGNRQYFVEWHGTVTGPGNYGHMGVSVFEFRVDSVRTLRAARRGDCL